MKYFLLFLPMSLPCAVLAQGGLFSTNVFSRQTINDWRGKLRDSEKAQDQYEEVMADERKKLGDADGYAKECPKSLLNCDIQLAEAYGSFSKRVPSTAPGAVGGKKWEDQKAKDTGDLNEVTLVFNVNGGLCGTIKVYTHPKEKSGIFGSYDWEWAGPYYSSLHPYNVQQLDGQKEAPVKSVLADEVTISAGDALKYAIREFPHIKANGFDRIELKKYWFDKKWNVQYRFTGLSGGPPDSPETVAVGPEGFVTPDPHEDKYWVDVMKFWTREYRENVISLWDRISIMTKWNKIPESKILPEFEDIPSREASETSMEWDEKWEKKGQMERWNRKKLKDKAAVARMLREEAAGRKKAN